MHIACPNCAATYQVTASAIGEAGRNVRCVRCRSVWFQQPIQDQPTPTAAPQDPAGEAAVAAFRSELGNTPPQQPAPAPVISENGAPAGPPLSELITPVADQPETAAEPVAAEQPVAAEDAPPVASGMEPEQPPAGDIESIAARRQPRSTARRRIPLRASRMPALILLLVCTVAALIAWRGSIVRHVPQLASLYATVGLPVNLRGLTFSDVKVSRDTHDGVQVLVVEGNIVSTASTPVEVPRLRFAMRNEVGGEIYAWTAMPSREVLGPGETMTFRSRLASPPGDGRDVTVRFFTRLDSIAGLR